MENTPEYRARYREYLDEVEAAVPTDRVPFVPQDLMENGLTLPYLATFLFNPFGPTVQTVSILGSGDRETPDLMIRRDLNPFAPPYQVPIGILGGSYGQRLPLSLHTLWHYLWMNGVGTRVTSREFVTSWPTAVLLPALTAGLSPVIATAFFDAARTAGLEVTGEYLRATRFGPKLWDRVSDEIDQVLDRMNGVPVPEPTEEGPMRWSSFLSWWSLVTSPEMVLAAISEVPAAWGGAIENSPARPVAKKDDLLRWLILFSEFWFKGQDPEETNTLPTHQIHALCNQFPTHQIRPAPEGWEISENDEGPETSPFERGPFGRPLDHSSPRDAEPEGTPAAPSQTGGYQR